MSYIQEFVQYKIRTTNSQINLCMSVAYCALCTVHYTLCSVECTQYALRDKELCSYVFSNSYCDSNSCSNLMFYNLCIKKNYSYVHCIVQVI